MAKKNTLAQQLGISGDPVQPPEFSRANLQLRPAAVRGGGWSAAVPGTLAASETNLGRLAGALAQGGGLMGQIAELKSKKAELEEKGLAVNHQTALSHMRGQVMGEKIKQLSMSLDMADQQTYEAQVNERWNTASHAEWNTMVSENARIVEESKEAAGKALNAVVEESAGMPLSALPPENRAVHHDLKRGSAAASLLDADLKRHLVDWAKETGEEGEFITKGSEDFDARVLEFIKQHKEKNEIIESTPADKNYNRTLKTYFRNVLPSLKEEFLDSYRKADLNNEVRQAADVLKTIPEADGLPPLPVAGLDPTGTVLPPKDAQQEYIESDQWVGIREKNNDEFDLFMKNTTMALVGEHSDEAIAGARNLLGMADADPDFKGYRGGKYTGSNHYNTLMAILDSAEEKLDEELTGKVDAEVELLLRLIEPAMTQTIYGKNKVAGGVGVLSTRLAQDVRDGDVTTITDLLGPDSDVVRKLANTSSDVMIRLNNRLVALLPTIQQNARSGNSLVMASVLGSADFNFPQEMRKDAQSIIATLPDSEEHKTLQKAFNNSGISLGEYSVTAKTQDLLGEETIPEADIHGINMATAADAKKIRLEMGQRIQDEFINDPANPKKTPPTEEELRRLMLDEQQILHKAWPVIWAKHAKVYLDEKALNAKLNAAQVKQAHDAAQAHKMPEDREDREPMKAWDLVKLARPVEKQDEKSLEGLTPGTPDYAMQVRKLGETQKERGLLFQKRWEHERKLMKVREESTKEEASGALTEAYTGWSKAKRGRLGWQKGEDIYLYPDTRVAARERGIDLAQKTHAEAFRNLLGFGMPYSDILDIVKTGTVNGKSAGSFVITLSEEYVSGKDFSNWTHAPHRHGQVPTGMEDVFPRKELTPHHQKILSAPVDNFMPVDVFEVVLPPITDLPVNGAVRTGTGKVKSIDLPAIRAAMESSNADLYTLAKAYGFTQEFSTAATREKSIINFLIQQYNTPYQRSKFSTSK